MLKSLKIRNFTVFNSADLKFAKGLNFIVGANGTGKTHLLKLPYAVMALSADEDRKRTEPPTKSVLQTRLAEKLSSVFRLDDRLGRLVHRQRGRNRGGVEMAFDGPRISLAFRFSSLVLACEIRGVGRARSFRVARQATGLRSHPGSVDHLSGLRSALRNPASGIRRNVARHMLAPRCSDIEGATRGNDCRSDRTAGKAAWRTGRTGQQRPLLP